MASLFLNSKSASNRKGLNLQFMMLCPYLPHKLHGYRTKIDFSPSRQINSCFFCHPKLCNVDTTTSSSSLPICLSSLASIARLVTPLVFGMAFVENNMHFLRCLSISSSNKNVRRPTSLMRSWSRDLIKCVLAIFCMNSC